MSWNLAGFEFGWVGMGVGSRFWVGTIGKIVGGEANSGAGNRISAEMDCENPKIANQQLQGKAVSATTYALTWDRLLILRRRRCCDAF